MSEMVERVARAMWAQRVRNAGKRGIALEAWNETTGFVVAGEGDLTVALMNDIFAEAKTAIEAMREPTADMKAADGVHWDYSCHVCGGLAEGWRAMIDEALKDT